MATRDEIKKVFDSICDYYGKEKLSLPALKIYCHALSGYTTEMISKACWDHIGDSDRGRFFPKVSDIEYSIKGQAPTPDEIIALARNKNTPLGILCRIKIGSWDLNNQDAFYLRQRAQECLQLLPEWNSRALAGEYTDHEVSMMLKHDVNPCAQLGVGLIQPLTDMQPQIERVLSSDKHTDNCQPMYDETSGRPLLESPLKSKIVDINKAKK